MIPTIIAPKRTLCGSCGGSRATVKKLRIPGSDAINRSFAFYMKDAQFDIFKPQVNFFLL